MLIKLRKKVTPQSFPRPDEIERYIDLRIPLPSKLIVILAILLALLLVLIPYKTKSMVTERQKCKVYSRICGYYSSTDGWNPGKASEWKARVPFSFPSEDTLNKNKSNI